MRVALVSEGTYPFAMGGVSVWCDQLIRGLPDYRWEMVALTVDGTERQVWASPPNLDQIRSIPLWRPRTPVPGRPGAAFLTAFDDFVGALLSPVPPGSGAAATNRGRFLTALRGLYEYAASGGDVQSALMSSPALTALVDGWYGLRLGRRSAPPEVPREPAGPATWDPGGRPPGRRYRRTAGLRRAPEVRTAGDLTLAEATEAAWLIAHMLRPLSVEPVVADVVHASMNGLCTLVGMAAKWRHGTPMVLSEHGIYLRERYISYLDTEAPYGVKVLILAFFRWLAGAAYLLSDALAPHSSYNRRWQLYNGADPARMWTMYNGVAPDEFPPAAAEPAEPTIAFMGRIDPLKDLHTLIRAFALVRGRLPGARLRIYGGTPKGNEEYRDSCLRLIDELGLAGAAALEGRVDSPVNAYHAGSLVALTSISEGFPYTVVEAMACGRTVVCTNVGGVAEAVADTGLVVPPRDVEAVAGACVELLSDDERRRELGRLARERVLANFTLRRSLDAYRGVYERATGRAPARVTATARVSPPVVPPLVVPPVSPAVSPPVSPAVSRPGLAAPAGRRAA